MDRFFWFWLLVTNLSVTESGGEDICLTQPISEIKRKVEQDALLPCTASAECSENGMSYKWFVFKKNQHSSIEVDFNSPRFSLDRASLRIKSLNVNDSGIYHCAAEWTREPTKGKQHVGMGTTLTVRALESMTKHILLWLSFVLLAIYSSVILTLILSKKNNSTNKARPKSQFRDVLQEMYNKKKLQSDTQTTGSNPSEAQTASSDLKSSIDDIYQNV
ncbi:Immunoglobulin superfamily member 6 [Channa argus]|nr:Immunoglobulin superfamily member 6 [Channa argus]